MTPKVSVVVPTYRRLDLLERCLQALRSQTLGPEQYEVVVVHDGPEPAAQTRVAALAAKWSLRSAAPLLYRATRAHGGPAGARNVGWRSARGPLIAFTDDDTVPDPHWLEAALACFEATGFDAAAGSIVVPLAAAPTDYERDAAGLEIAEFATANCFIRRSLLERLEGFDERFTAAWREDSDLHFRLLAAGARLVTIPAAVVVHPVRCAHFGVSLAQQRKVAFDALLYKKHPLLYRQRIRAHPRWDYYAIVAALLTGVAAIGAGALGTAAAAGVAWCALTARFCATRLRHTEKSARHVAEVALTSAAIPPLAVFWRAVGAVRYRVPFV